MTPHAISGAVWAKRGARYVQFDCSVEVTRISTLYLVLPSWLAGIKLVIAAPAQTAHGLSWRRLPTTMPVPTEFINELGDRKTMPIGRASLDEPNLHYSSSMAKTLSTPIRLMFPTFHRGMENGETVPTGFDLPLSRLLVQDK